MLQQTQVNAVVSHYDRFLQRFPTIPALAASAENDVLHAWAGLGYYRRALRLHQAAKHVVERFEGEIPNSLDGLCSLPGIGRSTAGAILSCAFDIPAPILDANVRRILSRFHAVNGPPDTKIPESHLWSLAIQHTPDCSAARYTQAIMDFGSRQCVRSTPDCDSCPLHQRCAAFLNNEVHLFPNRSSANHIEVMKRPLVILDVEGSCLLQQLDESGTFARLWDTPTLPENSNAEVVLESLGLPLDCVDIRNCANLEPYKISNQRVTEETTLAQFCVEASKLGTPTSTCWYKNESKTPLGMSVKTKKRIDLVRGKSEVQ